MSSHPRTLLTILALGAAAASPAPAALAQGWAAPPDAPPPTYSWSGDPATADPPPIPDLGPPQGHAPTGAAGRVAAWIAESDDNGGRPFMIVDKLGARIYAFDEAGEFLGSAPVLVGLARGDDSTPGIGELKLSQISVDERTTPAGRFVAGFGASNGHGTVLWVDPHDGIALHPVESVSPGEHRFQRIKSSNPGQHRISYGCINVPATFYKDVVLAALAGGDAIVYVLPDTKTVDEVFPAFAAANGDDRGAHRQQFSQAGLGSDPFPDQDIR